jgi:broad specificity phosphatase PhoE
MSQIIKNPFYFIRHGQTSWNDQNLCQGCTDIELNEAGRSEAVCLANALGNLSISALFSSPLKRAFETAQLIQKVHSSHTIQIVADLREREWGTLEGASSQEMYRIEKMEENNCYPDSALGIESRDLFKMRIAHAMNQILKNGDNPLIVSHGRVFLLLCELLGLPAIRQIPNTTLIKCTPSAMGWEIKLS